MPTWGVGDDHDSDEVRLLKEQLRTKDAAHATLNGQLTKREAELKEMKDSLNESLIKLRQDADRVVQLEADLRRRHEELSNEQLTRANIEAAVTTMERKLKDSQQTILENQSIIDSLSSQANLTSQGRTKLEQDNVALQTRVRALERELQNKAQAEDVALRQSQGPSASVRHRQQSDDGTYRISALETEVAELRTTSTSQAAELQRTTEQLTRARDALVQLQNEKTTTERQLQRQLEAAHAALEDREEDLRIMQDARGGEDVAAREASLLERLEEEEKRVSALEEELARSTGSRKRDLTMMQDELGRTAQLLEDANNRVTAAEGKLAQFVKDREAALRDREQERDRLSEHIKAANTRISQLEYQLSTLTQASPEEQTANTAKLLATVERLRGERDGLRRDLEFLDVENRFAVQSLEAKLAAATAAPAANTAELAALRGHAQVFQEQAQHSARAAVALAIVAQHTAQQEEAMVARIQGLLHERSVSCEQLHRVEHNLQEQELTVASLEQQLTTSADSVGSVETQANSLRTTIQRLEVELASERDSHAETGSALSDAEVQLNETSQALTDAEAARDALALEKAHLEADLETVRQELADAEARHTEQLAALSTAGQAGLGNQAALKMHVRDLEDRVMRRTEQIGLHQHDIKRLELNMKLQEERISEMTQELEVFQNEKIAMLEDCRTTREERDDAMQRCDELEEAMETLEEAREREVETVLRVAFDAIAAKRHAVTHSGRAIVASQLDHASLVERIRLIEDEKAVLSSQLSDLSTERDHLSHQAQQDLSSVQLRLEHISTTARAAEDAKSAAEAQLATLKSELESKSKELESLKSQLVDVHANHADRQSLDACLFAEEKAELENQLQQAHASREELKVCHQETVDELKRVEQELKHAEDELACYLSNSATHSETAEKLREDIARVRRERAEEVAALEVQLASVSGELEAMTCLRREADASRKVVEEELARTKEELETRLVEAGETLNTASRLEIELEKLRSTHTEEISTLQRELDAAVSELQDLARRREEFETLHEQAVQDSQAHETEAFEACERVKALEAKLAELKATHEEDLQTLRIRLDNAEKELQDARASADAQQCDAIDKLTRTVEELQDRLAVLTREADECRAELDEEKATHAHTRASVTAELRETIAMRDEAEAALSEAEKELPAVRAQLEHSESSLNQMEEEKLNLQYQVTNLEAEVQRAKSLQRFLESQVTDGERHVSELQSELSELRTKCTSLDKISKNTEANLAMQTIQHEQTVASLRRELNALRAQPSFEDEIAELKEKNAEYEELLRAKCLEIEENDDKFIEMLKAKKKLTNKVDSLTRKVQNLQTKLTAATEAAMKPVSPPAPAPPPKPPAVFSPSPLLAPAPILSGLSASSSRPTPTSRQRVVTAPAARVPEAAPFHPPAVPTYRPKTPESRLRMMSGPSSLSRPKTPESRPLPMPVFKARTPERHRAPTSTLPEASSSTSLIGVKRRAPDDFDDCAAVPPQTFTADSAPLGHTADGHTPPQPTTPRLRKALQSMRTGFTPVRHHGSRAGSASPRRATTGTSVPAPMPHTISDVTNSPNRPTSHPDAGKIAAKKGWLGKIKSAPSQQPRGVSSRQPVFGPPGMR